jgi:hypothetical protein
MKVEGVMFSSVPNCMMGDPLGAVSTCKRIERIRSKSRFIGDGKLLGLSPVCGVERRLH